MVVNTSKVSIAFEDGVIRISASKEAVLDAEDTEELVDAYLQVYEKYPAPLLSDIRNVFSITQEGFKVLTQDRLAEVTYASAILINSLGLRLLANFFISFHKPPFPVKVFSNEKDAREWLKKFKEPARIPMAAAV